jgi:DNA-binding transcriptional LysR family regulator
MDLRQLRYFIAIAEEEHFGRAAQHLRIAQPALTRQIQKLETELGTEVFERLSRGIRLSPAGRALKGDAQRILADLDQTIRHVQLIGRGKIGLLRLGFIEVAGWNGIVPQSIRQFRQAAPQVTVELVSMASLEQLSAVRESKLDAGFIYNAPRTDDDFTVQPVANHGVLLAAPDGSRLAAKKRVKLADLAEEPFVMFQRSGSPAFHDALFSAFRAGGIEPHVAHEATNEITMLTLVTSGAGIAVVNACNRWRQPHGVKLIPIEDLPVTLELCFVCLKENRSPPLMRFKTWFAKKRPVKPSAIAD